METINTAEATKIESFDELTKVNFKETRINLEDVYKLVCEHEEKIKEDVEPEEDGFETFKRLGANHLGQDKLDDVMEDFEVIYSFFSKFDVNSTVVKSMSEKNRDKLFAIAKNLVSSFIGKFNDFEINVTLTAVEIETLKAFFNSDFKFDIKEIYTLMDLEESFLLDWDEAGEFTHDVDLTLSPYFVQGFNYFLQTQKVGGDHKFKGDYKAVCDKFANAINFITASTIVTNRVKEDTTRWIGTLGEDLK